ncbi:Gfo/Idh/MocA family protein [Halalkalicoccus jeotgali]|uniref:Oxidoreductase n=1 Tax=Halalkalicoccus jeotgali (strain DSM 18796 / CECT 7217 / JCM 14584 / KCTC 4019 / B3) TaxID=795797 RepID=D8JAV4_HALJB|nr:Gfo/Idh/MocA family oxidoreductase [Halalkalicoccus jeotgali]ADJ14826.1 oxidoreductase [Halalkalicoccus jeotgali B3]ELY39409.1 oxidoreductase [Halalkalicoccus jeotgali B3]
MNDPRDVKIGVIGLGNIGRYHADRLRSYGAEIVGGMDVLPEARERFGRDYGVAIYEDHEELYSVADAIIVTTPNKFHEEYAVSALEAGLDVLLEKPLAHSVESAERIAAAAQSSEGFCMVGFHNRYLPSIEVLTTERDRGRFGDLSHVEANYIRRRGIPGRGSWFTSREIAGGGALIDIGVHALDLALYVLDFPEIAEVSGVARSEFGTREDYTYLQMWGDDAGHERFDVEDSVSAFIRCVDGQTISLEVAWAANRPTDNEFVVRGSDAGARFDRASGDMTIYETSADGSPHFNDTQVKTRERDAHAAEQETFLQAVAAGEPPERNTVEQGLLVQRVIDAIYRSSEKGRTITFDERPLVAE